MVKNNKLYCPTCEKGELIPCMEPYNVQIGEDRFVASDPVNFLRCTNCGGEIFIGDENIKTDRSAAKNLLLDVAQKKKVLLGEDIIFLRSVFRIQAKDLSLKLNLDTSTVSKWENRNTELSYPVALTVAIFFISEYINSDDAKIDLNPLIVKAFSDVA